MSRAQLEVEQESDVTIATVVGEIDISNARELKLAIAEAVPNHSRGLVVDLVDVTYLDSAGVNLLFELARRLLTRRQAMRVVAPREAPVRGILTLTGANRVLALDDDAGEARTRIRDPRVAPGDDPQPSTS